MNSKTKIFGIVGFIFVILGFIGKIFYRDYIHSNHIGDFGFSGFLPSFFYVVGFSQMLLMTTSKYPKTTIFVVTLASVLFEFKQFYSTTILDVEDIVVSLIGGLISILLWRLINKKNYKRFNA